MKNSNLKDTKIERFVKGSLKFVSSQTIWGYSNESARRFELWVKKIGRRIETKSFGLIWIYSFKTFNSESEKNVGAVPELNS